MSKSRNAALNPVVRHLSFFGLGKLGLPLAALFARSGLQTSAVDIDGDLIRQLQAGELPYPEPGLGEILAEATPAITYSARADLAADSDVSIVLVDTPSDPSSPVFSTAQVEDACSSLCRALVTRRGWRYHLVIIGSTMFPGTTSTTIKRILEDELNRSAGEDFGLAYVPDFVALGDVVQGYRNPPFLLVGSDDSVASERAVALYRRIVGPATPVRTMSVRDAELAKLLYNAFLCMKISFGNFLAQLGDGLGGADLDAITETFALDPRIGIDLLRPGAPYGGACLPRDIDALLHLARSMQIDAPLARASAEVNAAQYDLIERHIMEGRPRLVAVLGLSFKSGTPITRGSPGFEFVRRCLARSIPVVAFDPAPQARSDARETFGAAIACCDALEDCLCETDTFLVCNADVCFADIARSIPFNCRIIDPWGCVRGPHPGLIRIGRKSDDAVPRGAARIEAEAWNSPPQ